MRKLLDTKAGATFYEEMPNLTFCPRKDSIEFIFKLKSGIYVIINMTRGTGGKIMLYANWDKYFMRMQNPDVQLPRIKKNCPTLFAVLTGEDNDDVSLLSHRNAPAHERGFGVFCDGDVDTPLIAHIDNNLLDKVAMLVNKNVDIYNELNTTPPFPAWKDGLSDLWN